MVESSASQSIALTSRGAVYGWGEDTGGLGLVPDDGLPPKYDQGATHSWDVITPHQIMTTDIDVATGVAVGHKHTLLCTRRQLYAIGNNRQGQLGVGDTANRHEFTRVSLPDVALSLAAGAQHSVVATVQGHVFVFGSNQFGQLGLDSEEEGTALRSVYSTPRRILTLRDHFIVHVAAGLYYSVALTATEKVFLWGCNDVGQLGLGDLKDRPSPVLLAPFSKVKSIACGLSHTVLVLGDGSVWGSGKNNGGQLGLGHFENQATFSKVLFQEMSYCDTLDPGNLSVSFLSYVCVGGPDRPISMSAVRIACGDSHTLAIAQDGNVWGWGLNSHGQLGLGLAQSTPLIQSVLVPRPLASIYLANATSATGGSAHTLLRTDFQKAVIHEVMPRMGPSSRSARTQIWWLGLGFNSLRDHSLRCVFYGPTIFETIASVFSNFRAVCPSPSATSTNWTADSHLNSSARFNSPQYRIFLNSKGVAPTDATSTQPRQPVSEMTGGIVDSKNNFSFYMLEECMLADRSTCAQHCSQGGPQCFAGIVSSMPLSGPREGGTNVTIVGYGFFVELASDVRCRSTHTYTCSYTKNTHTHTVLLLLLLSLSHSLTLALSLARRARALSLSLTQKHTHTLTRPSTHTHTHIVTHAHVRVCIHTHINIHVNTYTRVGGWGSVAVCVVHAHEWGGGACTFVRVFVRSMFVIVCVCVWVCVCVCVNVTLCVCVCL